MLQKPFSNGIKKHKRRVNSKKASQLYKNNEKME